jgi:hypothetical protein
MRAGFTVMTLDKVKILPMKNEEQSQEHAPHFHDIKEII